MSKLTVAEDRLDVVIGDEIRNVAEAGPGACVDDHAILVVIRELVREIRLARPLPQPAEET